MLVECSIGVAVGKRLRVRETTTVAHWTVLYCNATCTVTSLLVAINLLLFVIIPTKVRLHCDGSYHKQLTVKIEANILLDSTFDSSRKCDYFRRRKQVQCVCVCVPCARLTSFCFFYLVAYFLPTIMVQCCTMMVEKVEGFLMYRKPVYRIFQYLET